MRSRSSRGRRSSINSPVNEVSVAVARSEPEPLTHSIRAGRPRKSTSSAFAEVLPPPQLQTVRSAPSLRDRATSCASVVETDPLVIVYMLLVSNGNSPMKNKQHRSTYPPEHPLDLATPPRPPATRSASPR